MKRYVVISTYPEHGSKNIGDFLITQSLVAMIRKVSYEDFTIRSVWRADSWDAVKETILSADHVFFACLAIRPDLGSKIYPFALELLRNHVSFSVHAAGTDLRVGNLDGLFPVLDVDTTVLLRELDAAATEFTTRGVLTQEFCERLGLEQAQFEGDLAFYEPERQGLPMKIPTEVSRIVVSDPHRSPQYMKSFDALLDGLMQMFPRATVDVVLHGVNPEIEEFCAARWIDCLPIYKDPESGLEVYENYDLHIGYRVHGHVTALKKRRPSYLLEQDGRGTDYGMTLSRRMSVSNYPQLAPPSQGTEKMASYASAAAPQALLSMLRQDIASGFKRFEGLERELTEFSIAAERRVARVLSQVKEA